MFNWFRKNKIKKINSALGIELQPWQIEYIFNAYPNVQIFRGERSSYKTLTLILRQILNKKAKYIWTLGNPLGREELIARQLEDYTPIYIGTTKPSMRGRNFLLKWRQVYRKLSETDLKLAQVVWIR